jgi:hypothetical protein
MFTRGADPPAAVRKLMPIFRGFFSAALTKKLLSPAAVPSTNAVEPIRASPFHLSSPTLNDASLIRTREIG